MATKKGTKNMDYELTLFDRIEVIKTANKKYDLEHNAYISFSGGKDSTIVHHLIDMALPNNRIPRVFINTGIEYNDIVAFVKKMAEKDDRFIILKPSVPVKPMLEKYGYPFKSKEFANIYAVYQRSGKTKSVRKFLKEEPSSRKIVCPAVLKPLFETQLDFKISSKCCDKMKKEPIHKWEKENHRSVSITGMRNSEGGQRLTIKGCILTDDKGNLKKFHPLLKVDDAWEDEFVSVENIQLCKLYYPPYNFQRTGCKGCPYNLKLAEQLGTMMVKLPNERMQCEALWKPSYDLYRKMNYRLSNQMNIFEEGDYDEKN